MNKLLLAISVVVLALTGVNTAILLQLSGTLKETADRIEPVGKAMQSIQPVLEKVSAKLAPPTGDDAPAPALKPSPPAPAGKPSPLRTEPAAKSEDGPPAFPSLPLPKP